MTDTGIFDGSDFKRQHRRKIFLDDFDFRTSFAGQMDLSTLCHTKKDIDFNPDNNKRQTTKLKDSCKLKQLTDSYKLYHEISSFMNNQFAKVLEDLHADGMLTDLKNPQFAKVLGILCADGMNICKVGHFSNDIVSAFIAVLQNKHTRSYLDPKIAEQSIIKEAYDSYSRKLKS